MPEMKCAQCSAENAGTAQFCSQCGARLSVEMSDAQPEAPPSFVTHSDRWSGYSLAHPPGWKVRNVRGSVIVSEDAKEAVAAWISSAPLAGASSLQEFATRYVNWMQTQEPSFEGSLVTGREPAGAKLQLRTCSLRGALRLEGRVDMVLRDRNVVIRGFQVPAAADGSMPRSSEMLQVLNSFRMIPPVQRQFFREPKEDAFAALVPSGWSASGKVSRSIWTGLASCEFSAQADARGLTKLCIPGTSQSFMDSFLGKRFTPAREFAAKWLAKSFP
jgi:hypothetical protein